MSDLDATTPRVFLARHGETEWTISGHHTGISDIPLTPLGEIQVSSTGRVLVGPGKLLDPRQVRRVWVSPRQRAIRTFQLLFKGASDKYTESTSDNGGDETGREDQIKEVAGVKEAIFGYGTGCVVVSEQIREWDYGEYEGMTASEVRELRKLRGLDKNGTDWNVWRDGCEGGESKEDVKYRLDQLISEIQSLQKPYMKTGKQEIANVVLVAHGLILRCFIKRWLKLPVDHHLPMMLSPGAIAILSYKSNNIEKPAFFVGMSLPASVD